MSARLDPEDMREIIRAYQDACTGVIARYDGFVAKFMGDGVLAYFGFPQRPRRRRRAGGQCWTRHRPTLSRVSRRRRTNAADAHRCRDRFVVVGDLVGARFGAEQAVIGDTPNLAARLQSLAEPGGVVIADQTRRLLGDAVRVEAAGAAGPQGLRRAGRAWAVCARPRREPLRSVAIERA